MEKEQDKKINSEGENENPKEISEEIARLQEKLAKCEKEKEEYLNGWKRAKADYINYQKDEMRRYAEAMNYANEELIKELLSVLDSFELSYMAMTDGNEKIKKGVEIIHSQLEKTLNKYGLEQIKSIGMKFDPNIHEAIEEIVSDKEPGIVAEELVKGWKLNGKVIRPAKVKVAKK